MSLVSSRVQPQKSNANLDPLSLLKLNGSSTSTSTSTVLQDMLASASKMPFGEPVGKNTWAINSGVREITAGPRSPKMNGKVNGHGNTNGHTSVNGKTNGHGNASDSSEEDEEDGSPSPSKSAQAGPSGSKIIGPMPPTPTRKGKEPASSHVDSPNKSRANGPTGRILHKDPIELSWPVQLRNRKQSAAGLFNPSMACYANATLQVLLHTPPVLRMAQAHGSGDCESCLCW
jgi:hypothetical protein